jgi:hypothetical protein
MRLKKKRRRRCVHKKRLGFGAMGRRCTKLNGYEAHMQEDSLPKLKPRPPAWGSQLKVGDREGRKIRNLVQLNPLNP